MRLYYARHCTRCWDIIVSRIDSVLCGADSKKKKKKGNAGLLVQRLLIFKMVIAEYETKQGPLLSMASCAIALDEAGPHGKP